MSKMSEQIKTTAADQITATETTAVAVVQAQLTIALANAKTAADVDAVAQQSMDSVVAIHTTAATKMALLVDGQKGDWAGLWAAIQKDGANTYKTSQEQLAAYGVQLAKWGVTAADGVAAGMATIASQVQTVAQSMSTFVQGVWNAIGSGFQNTLYGVLSGTQKFSDSIKGFFNSILQAFSKMVSDIVQKWIIGIFNMQSLSAGKGINPNLTTEEMAGAGLGGGVTTTGGGLDYKGALAGLGLGLAVGSAANGAGSIESIITGIAGAIGSLWGPIVGALAAALTAVVGVMMVGQTEKKQTISNTPDDVLAATTLATIKNNAGIMSASLQGMFQQVDPSQAAAWTKKLNTMISDYIKGMSLLIHAGSDADFNADIKTLMSGVVPTALLAKFFGLTPDSKAGGVPGIGGSAAGYGGQFDPNAPIPKMLEGIGVTAAKIQEIALSINTEAPDVFMKWLQQFVGVIVQANKLVVDLGKSGAQMLADYETTLHETDVQKLRTTVADLTGRGAQVGNLSGQAQLDAASQLVTDIQAAFDQLQKSIAAIGQAIDAFSASVDGLIKQTEFNLLSPWEQTASLNTTAYGAAGKVAGATTSADAITAANEGLAAFQALLSTALAAIQSLQQAIVSFTSKIDDILKTTEDALKTPAELKAANEATAFGAAAKVAGAANSDDAIKAANEGIAAFQELLTAALAWRAAAMAALDTLDGYIATMNGTAATYETVGSIQAGIARAATMTGMDQVNQINTVGAAAMKMWQANVTEINTIAAMIKSITQSISDQIFGNNLSMMDPQGQAGAIGQRMKDLWDQLQKATDPATIQALTSQIQSLGGQYLGTFAADDPNRGAAVTWVNNFLKMIGTFDTTHLTGISDDLKGANALLLAALNDARTILSTNITAAGGAIWDLTVGINALKVVIQVTLKGYIDDLNTEVANLIKGLRDLRAGFNLAMTGFADELTLAAKPLKDELDAMLAAVNSVSLALDAPKVGLAPQADRATKSLGDLAGAAGDLVAVFGNLVRAGSGGSGSAPQSAPVYVTSNSIDSVGPRAAAWIRANPSSISQRLGR
jgi:phage tail protein X